MENGRSGKRRAELEGYTVLVAIDFSSYSAQALRYATSILGRRPGRILALHVIDRDFVEKCIRNELGAEEYIQKTLFLRAKAELKNFLKTEGMDEKDIESVICQGVPFIEINKKAVETGADIVVMGNRGNSGDMKTIFFGSTAERVLRFMKRPVLCIPMDEDQELK